MSLFLDRSRRAGPYLEWKVRMFAVAAVLGLGGIYFDERWLGAVAIVLLVAGLLIRFVPFRGAAHAQGAADDEDDDPES